MNRLRRWEDKSSAESQAEFSTFVKLEIASRKQTNLVHVQYTLWYLLCHYFYIITVINIFTIILLFIQRRL